MITSSRGAVLALGGGGAKGLAHLGVVEVLQQYGLPIDRYVGVSIGSLAGALCSVEPDAAVLQKNVMEYLNDDSFQQRQAMLFQVSPPKHDAATTGLLAWYHRMRRFFGQRRQLLHQLRKPSLLPGEVLQEVVDHLLPDICLSKLPVPLSVVALDLYSGMPVVLDEGSLRNAVTASMAIPGVFPPVKWGEWMLCDIGVVDAVPVKIARRFGGEPTIAVEVGGPAESIAACHTAGETFVRLSDVTEHLVRAYSLPLADIVIAPDVTSMHWSDFSRGEQLIQAGRNAARSELRRLRRYLDTAIPPLDPDQRLQYC